jgi:S-formylglutathione hydrolase FrmB
VLALRARTGYDHSDFFIASFMKSHLRFHAGVLVGCSE